MYLKLVDLKRQLKFNILQNFCCFNKTFEKVVEKPNYTSFETTVYQINFQRTFQNSICNYGMGLYLALKKLMNT